MILCVFETGENTTGPALQVLSKHAPISTPHAQPVQSISASIKYMLGKHRVEELDKCVVLLP